MPEVNKKAVIKCIVAPPDVHEVLMALSRYYHVSIGDVIWLMLKNCGEDLLEKCQPLKFDEEKLKDAKEALKKL